MYAYVAVTGSTAAIYLVYVSVPGFIRGKIFEL